MSLFRKRKRLSLSQERVALGIAGKILLYQRRLADYLNAKTAGLSSGTWLYLLIGFCMVSASYLLYLLAQLFN